MNRISFLNRGYAFKGLLAVYDVVAKIQPISDVKLTSDACWGRVFRICRQS